MRKATRALLPLIFGLSSLLAGTGCRKCSWPTPVLAPNEPSPPTLDWSNLRLTPTDVYVSLRRCGCERRSRFLAIDLEPLPSAFWREGGIIDVELEGRTNSVMVLSGDTRYKTLYFYGPTRGKQAHELRLTLRGPSGEVIDQQILRVGPEIWKKKKYQD